jgi:hypothetical protein
LASRCRTSTFTEAPPNGSSLLSSLKGWQNANGNSDASALFAALCSIVAKAQQVEPSLPLSQRLTLNLAAGVPGYIGNAASGSNAPQSQWWFENTNNSTEYSAANFVESTDSSAKWQQVGLPYDANITRTFINQTSGGGQGSLTGNENWYRLHFKVDPTYSGQKFLLNIEGAHTGVQVFINGTLLPGISAVAANAQATHVVGFIPVVVDLTPYIHTDGITDNVIAVDVSRGDPWFEQPGFSGAFRFGPGHGQAVSQRLPICNQSRSYSNQCVLESEDVGHIRRDSLRSSCGGGNRNCGFGCGRSADKRSQRVNKHAAGYVDHSDCRTATAPGLVSGSVQLPSVTPSAPTQSPPAIIVPPVSTSVTAGFPATFTVAANGSGTLTYQWYLNNNPVAGATGTTYTTPATTLADNGDNITVTVTSTLGYGTVTANAVTLSVSAPANAAITTQPASQNAVVGQSATFTVGANGSPQLNYQWFVNGVQVASGPQNSYTTPVLSAPGTETVYVVVSNPLNQVQSTTAVLTINAATPVSITTQPVSQIVPANQPVQIAAVVGGSAPYTYQWQFTPAGGATTILSSNTQISNTITYTIPVMTVANVGVYTLTVNNAASVPVTSAAAQLTLAPPGINLALDMPAASSSTQNACGDGTTAPPYSGANCLGPENAVDGSLGTRWASASAGAPPSPPFPGVDPSWLQVDLGFVQAFNTVIINWENAYATQYQILYTNDDPSTNPTWNVAYTNNAGAGGTETLNIPTVQGRYIRMQGIQRATQYGYSLYEFQGYNVAQCGGSTERYTVNSSNPSLVLDNLLGLTWTRTIQTDTAPGSQFTGLDAANYCSNIKMRLPTQAEAFSISGNNNASCAFPGTWNTWTSTVNPNDPSETAIVNFDGTSTWNVTNNFPGATLCAAGTSTTQPPLIQPQPATVVVGQSAIFTVAATGIPTPTYQWFENGTPIPGATAPTYITQPTASTDNGRSSAWRLQTEAAQSPATRQR